MVLISVLNATTTSLSLGFLVSCWLVPLNQFATRVLSLFPTLNCYPYPLGEYVNIDKLTINQGPIRGVTQLYKPNEMACFAHAIHVYLGFSSRALLTHWIFCLLMHS
jgi:hypothetical protein